MNFVSNFDLLFFSETWQRNNSKFEINGYNSIFVPRKESLRNNRSKRGHGGVCLFYRDHLHKGIFLEEIDENGIIWIKLCKHFFGLEQDIFVCCLYIPPSSSVYYTLHDVGFFEILEQKVSKYSELGKVSVIGDLNARCGDKPDILQNSSDFDKYIDVINKDDNNDYMFDIPHRFSMDSVVNSSGNKLLDICLSSNLKIINGRIGDDAGVGSFTNMSIKGNSLIDYVLCSYDLFPFVTDFIVHDFHTCSTHAPIQVNFDMKCLPDTNDKNVNTYEKIVWDNVKTDEFKNVINSEIFIIDEIVNNIVTSSVDLNTGVDNIASRLYEKTFGIFGRSKSMTGSKSNRKYKSPWYTSECENARREFRAANRVFRKNRSYENSDILLAKRRRYNLAKRRARAQHSIKQRNNLHNLAKSQPQKFWNEIRKIKNKKPKGSDISEQDFFLHFKNLFSSDNIFSNNDVEDEMLNDEINQSAVEQLDIDFSINEVKNAMSSLKRGKSGGIDLLIPEIFLECSDVLSPVFCKLFNYIYSQGIYPESWTKGILVPVPKKGNLNDVNNYRGITLTSVFSKIFSTLLDNRLRKWAEDNNLLSDYQFGFRQGKSTIDCIFVLNSIMKKIIAKENKKVYCAFVDFRKAFDVVYRDGIWYKLLRYGGSSKIVKMLEVIYNSVKTCVRVNGNRSDYFDSYTGVKQGEPLSPLLFIFFINDMYDSLYDNSVESFNLEDLKLFVLLFADDTVLFSYTKEGLQLLLNNLHSYCRKWGVTVNIDKTVIMICKKGNRQENVDFFYNNNKLKNVNKFTYLGVTLSSNGSFYQSQKSLSAQAMKAMFSLNSLFDIVSMNVSEKMKLFDSMINPILSYGSEVWGFHKAPDIERVHLKFMKQVLGVRQQTTNAAIYGELGRFPLIVLRNVRIVKYWYKIIKAPDSLMHKLFNMKNATGNYVNDWTINVKHLLENLGFAYLWNNTNVTKLQLNSVIQRIYDQYIQQWYTELSNSRKLETYCIFKDCFVNEKYLHCVNNINYRVALTRFRCSAHRLLIEEGRYRNIERDQRICNMCNMNAIETEYHFLLVCPRYRELRFEYLPNYYCAWPNIQKFKSLMQTCQKSKLNQIAKFIYLANALRDLLVNGN